MNILIISRGIPTKQDPQWGSFEFDQAKALAKEGHHVIIASVDSRLRFYRRPLGLTIGEDEGVKTYNMFFCPSAIVGLLGKRIHNRFVAWQWRRLERAILQNEDHIDIVYPHYLFNSHKVVNCFKDIHAPIVAIEHWSELNKEPLPKEVQAMADSTYPHVARVITVAKSLQQRLKQLFGLHATIVYNMVGDEFNYTPNEPKDKVRYITTGSLISRKGFDMFAPAFSQLNLPKDKWELLIIGEGQERETLQKQIDKYGFTNNILLVGLKNKHEIAKLLNESNAFVLPSRNENFSVAVLEALACGLPVIASICGGIRECINDKNGLLFEVDDVNGLAKALDHIFYHHKEYDRQAIADDCKSRFSSEVIAKQLTSIFEEVIQ